MCCISSITWQAIGNFLTDPVVVSIVSLLGLIGTGIGLGYTVVVYWQTRPPEVIVTKIEFINGRERVIVFLKNNGQKITLNNHLWLYVRGTGYEPIIGVNNCYTTSSNSANQDVKKTFYQQKVPDFDQYPIVLKRGERFRLEFVHTREHPAGGTGCHFDYFIEFLVAGGQQKQQRLIGHPWNEVKTTAAIDIPPRNPF